MWRLRSSSAYVSYRKMASRAKIILRDLKTKRNAALFHNREHSEH